MASKYKKYPAQPPPARASGNPTAFRQFAIAVHDVDGVPEACVLLQDRCDLDVNVLLLGSYIGVQGKSITAEHVDAARAVVDEWHNDIVRTAALRRHVAESELDAELVELDELGKWADELQARAVAGSAIESAMAAMEAVVQSYRGGPADSEAAGALAAIAKAAADAAGCDR